MRAAYLVTLSATLLLRHGVNAKEVQPNALKSQIYDSGSVHEELMAKKMVRPPRPNHGQHHLAAAE